MVWVAFALMTGAVVFAVLWPLGRARTAGAREPEVAFYRTQVADIDREAALGLLAPADAEAAKAEAARRLLHRAGGSAAAAPSRSAVRVAALIALIAIPALAVGIYTSVGNPEIPDQPLKARLAARQPADDIRTAIAKIEQHLATSPDDGKGWEVLAPVYMRLGQFDKAAHAFAEMSRILGETPDRLSAQAQALVFAARNQVTPQAQELFRKVLASDPKEPTSRFFLALAQEQAGDTDGALTSFKGLLADSPPNAPWLNEVRNRISLIEGAGPGSTAGPQGEAATAIRSLPQGEQQAAIRGMVEQLATRLRTEGGDVESWLRLVRAYKVLQEPDRAREAFADARKALAEDKAALTRLDDLAKELGLEG